MVIVRTELWLFQNCRHHAEPKFCDHQFLTIVGLLERSSENILWISALLFQSITADIYVNGAKVAASIIDPHMACCNSQDLTMVASVSTASCRANILQSKFLKPKQVIKIHTCLKKFTKQFVNINVVVSFNCHRHICYWIKSCSIHYRPSHDML